MSSFLSPNSYSFDKFARLQDYFMSSLGQTEGFQDRMCNTNEYGMAVLHEPFYQDNQSNVPSSEEVPTDPETTTTTTIVPSVEAKTTTTTPSVANNVSVTKQVSSLSVSEPTTKLQNNANLRQKTAELVAELDTAKAREDDLKAKYDAQVLEERTKFENEKKTLLKWNNKNINSKLDYSELSYANGAALEAKYIPVQPAPASSANKVNSLQQALETTTTTQPIMPKLQKQIRIELLNPGDVYKLDADKDISKLKKNDSKDLSSKRFALTGDSGTINEYNINANKINGIRRLVNQDIEKYNQICTESITDPIECNKLLTSYNMAIKQIEKLLPNLESPKQNYDTKYAEIQAIVARAPPKVSKSKSKSKSKFWDIVWRNPLEAFTVDEGLNSNLPKNKISASNKKPTNKSKSTTSKMSNRRNNNNNRMREEDDIETSTTMMSDKDMETTTTRKATSKKANNKANNRKPANNEDMEEETTTSTMMADEEGEMNESTEPADESTEPADESTGSADESTERGPDGDMETEEDTSEPTDEVTEGFSGSRVYRFGHLSTALKALLLALLFWLLTNTAGSAYVAKLAKRVGASTCVVQVIVFFVLAYIALMI